MAHIPPGLRVLIMNLVRAYEDGEDTDIHIRRLESHCMEEGMIPIGNYWSDGRYRYPIEVTYCEGGSICPHSVKADLEWCRREYSGMDTVRLQISTEKDGWALVDVPYKTFKRICKDAERRRMRT